MIINYLQVIGVPDARLGEEVCAWIKLRESETSTEQEIKDFCQGKVISAVHSSPKESYLF